MVLSINSPDDIVCPGDFLGSTIDYSVGTNTHLIENTQIVSLIVGLKQIETIKESDPLDPSTKVISSTISVVPLVNYLSPELPTVGQIVTCRVRSITPQFAKVQILTVHSSDGEKLINDSCSGIIRQRDIQSFDIDNASISRSFRPMDLVRAIVISSSDSKNYSLSTAQNDSLGVLAAYSSSAPNVKMIPIDWEHFQCPITGVKETRKVAKRINTMNPNNQQSSNDATTTTNQVDKGENAKMEKSND